MTIYRRRNRTLNLTFRGKNQLPLIMLYWLWFDETGEAVDGHCFFNTGNFMVPRWHP